MIGKFVTAGAVLALAGSASAAQTGPFSIGSVDLGNIVAEGQVGLFGSNIRLVGQDPAATFQGFRQIGASNKAPAQGTTNTFFLNDSYAGLDGGQLVADGSSTAGPAGPTFGGNNTTYPPILGYQSNNSFSFIPFGPNPGDAFTTLDPYLYGGGWFQTSAETTTNFAGLGHRMFMGQLTAQLGATRASLSGGVMNVLLTHIGDGGTVVSLPLNGAGVTTGVEVNSNLPVQVDQTYYLRSYEQPDVTLGAAGAHQQWHLFIEVAKIPTPGASALFGLAGLAMIRRRR